MRRSFRRGEFIFRRRQGPALTASEISLLSDDERRHLCELDWNHSAVLFPPGCYLNHSCEPNAMRSGVKVFAWRDVEAGEEITIDYRLNAFDDTERWPCLCGHCAGTVTGSFFALSIARADAYLPYAPRFIRLEYQRRRVLLEASRSRAAIDVA
ncbi:MAG: SET domain-containing protein-lysine N-methyltransferase [Dehalococcoidia bacterium]